MGLAPQGQRRNPASTQGARTSDHDTSQREKLWDLIKDMRFGMFTTRHDNGHLHSRPMTTQNKAIDEDDSLWFFMSRAGDPVHDLEQSEEVNVTYADPGKDTYVSVCGKARLVEGMAVKRRPRGSPHALSTQTKTARPLAPQGAKREAFTWTQVRAFR